jgi:aminomethyltransferase
MAPFAGYEMPIQYGGIIEEHQAVRQAAGLFDVSHMGEFYVRGADALEFLQRVVTNDVATLHPGKALYTVMCHPDGGTIDDLLIYRLGDDVFLLVVNAANVQKDLDHLRSCLDTFELDCSIEDRSDMTALLALQGPRSLEIASRVTDLPLDQLKYYHFLLPEPGQFLDCREALIARTGYTGELGLEIYCDVDSAERVWQALMGAGKDLGLAPCGLGARDTLRLEAGFSLYGHELTDEITPLEAGLGWVVKLDKDAFVGKDALAQLKQDGLPRRLVGFVLEDRGVPRAGYPLADPDGTIIGEVTSGSQSPMLGVGIGLGLVRNEPRYTEPGSEIAVSVRGRLLRATVRRPPFHKAPA